MGNLGVYLLDRGATWISASRYKW